MKAGGVKSIIRGAPPASVLRLARQRQQDLSLHMLISGFLVGGQSWNASSLPGRSWSSRWRACPEHGCLLCRGWEREALLHRRPRPLHHPGIGLTFVTSRQVSSNAFGGIDTSPAIFDGPLFCGTRPYTGSDYHIWAFNS